jgi:hypothetical protein
MPPNDFHGPKSGTVCVLPDDCAWNAKTFAGGGGGGGGDQNRDPVAGGYQYRAPKGSKTRPTLEQAIIRPFAQDFLVTANTNARILYKFKVITIDNY